jgi:hypothetical protein
MSRSARATDAFAGRIAFDGSIDRRSRNFGTFATKKANNEKNNGTLVAIFSQKSRDIARERTGEQSPKTAEGKNRALEEGEKQAQIAERSMKGRGTHPCTWRGRPPRAQTCGACRGVDFREIARQRGRAEGGRAQ